MKTSEFIKEVEELGFTTMETKYSISVHNQGGKTLFHVRKDLRLALDTLWSPGVTEELFDLAVEYVKTPIDEREEPKKYYLRHKYLYGYNRFNFLNFENDGSFYSLSTHHRGPNYQTEFTQKEIDNFPFEVIASEWELIEVEE